MPPRTTVAYHSSFVAELQTMEPRAMRELMQGIKTAFRGDWEKRTVTPMNDKRIFYLPKVGGFTLIGCKSGENEVILLFARRS